MTPSIAPESPLITAVRSLDAAGRHNDALAALARAVAAGDAPAMSELGHRLLVGRNSPLLPEDGLRFIRDAAAKGEPHALHRLAALTAGGAFFPQNWAGAFRLLAQAAEAGSNAAQRQLAALAPEVPSGTPWQQYADAVDVAAWLTPPSTESLTPDAKVVRVPNLAPAGVCAWLIDRSRGNLERARVYDAVNGQETTSETRSNSAANFDLATVDVVQFLLQARMSAACGLPWVCMESPMVLHYDVGEQITDHYDFVDPQSPNYAQLLREQGQRMVTFLLYLNEEYSGGETDFPELGVRHKGSRGEGLYFKNAHADGQPDQRMVHAGRPPESGEKWIVSQFIRNISLRG
jgi:prolyl 4-hydroxylase